MKVAHPVAAPERVSALNVPPPLTEIPPDANEPVMVTEPKCICAPSCKKRFSHSLLAEPMLYKLSLPGINGALKEVAPNTVREEVAVKAPTVEVAEIKPG